MRKLFFLFIIASAALSAEGGAFHSRLKDHYQIGVQEYLILEDNTVWQLHLCNERERTWGEWFAGQEPPQATPGTTYKPQNWEILTPLTGQITDMPLSEGSKKGYLLHNPETGEYAYASKCNLIAFLGDIAKTNRRAGYEKGLAEGQSTSQNEAYSSGYKKGYDTGYGAAVKEIKSEKFLTVTSLSSNIITLSNGKRYEVLTSDWYKCSGVKVEHKVKIEESNNYFYPYLLSNLNLGTKVQARLLS